MSETSDSQNFDAYHKWLAIPPKDQPPNHYRLLAIELFETDLDVIGNAADQRMSHLKSFQSGPYGKLSQKLLNEIAAARTCLLNAEQKLRYDASLRGGLLDVVDSAENGEAAKPARVAAPAARTAAPAAASARAPQVDVATDTPSRRTAAPAAKPKKKTNPKRDFKINVIGHIIAPIMGLFLGYIVLGLIVPKYSLFGSSDGGNGVAGTVGGAGEDGNGNVDGADGGQTDHTDGSVDGGADGSDDGDTDGGQTDATTDGTPAADGSTPSDGGTSSSVADGATDGQIDGVSDGATPSSDDAVDGAADGATDGTDPPPDEPTPEERQLAALEAQREQAIATGNVQQALDAIGSIAILKEEDPIAVQIKALGSYREKAKSPDDFQTIVKATLRLIDTAVAAERIAEARQLATRALGDARRSNDQTLINRATLKFIELRTKGSD